MLRFPAVAALFLLASVPGAAPAQARRLDPAAAAAALARLTPAQTVRIEDRVGIRTEGRFGGVAGTTLRLSQNGAAEEVDLSRLAAVWVRGRQTKAGAIIGGAAGLGVALFFGLIANGVCETDECRGVGPYLVYSAIFVPGGALVGAAIGAAIPRWRRIAP
ncbi:MAG: hypothetical protein ACRENB_09470 [Gemmatimonadales bacterium]